MSSVKFCRFAAKRKLTCNNRWCDTPSIIVSVGLFVSSFITIHQRK
jgi:hypothetical protein